jgi:hypothetical protein
MWRDEPATEKQVDFLRRFGWRPDGPLTKGQASDLIEQFQGDEGRREILWQNDAKEEAYRLHSEVEAARSDPDLDLQDAIQVRLDWWLSVFNVGECGSQLGLDLWESYAKHFDPPTPEQAQAILSGLDEASPNWDKEHPRLFFETLELNHPELRTM